MVLCAGGGSRYLAPGGGHKLLAPFGDRPLVRWALDNAVAAGLDATLAVTGAIDLGAVVPEGVLVVDNREWAGGIGTSLAAAVRAARRLALDAIVVGLGDQPLIPPAAWQAVAASAAKVAVATYAGQRRNPVRLARSVWDDLPATGDEGARALMRRRPDLVEEVPCPGDPADIDTVSDLTRRPGPGA